MGSHTASLFSFAVTATADREEDKRKINLRLLYLTDTIQKLCKQHCVTMRAACAKRLERAFWAFGLQTKGNKPGGSSWRVYNVFCLRPVLLKVFF